MPEDTISGHCVCGKHHITIPKPSKMNLCHCVDCRRWAGSMYSAHIMTDGATSITGPEPRTYTVQGIDGHDMTRAWCDTCGSGLWIRSGPEAPPKNFKAGLFEPGDVPPPTSEVFTKDMESWEKPAEGAKQFEANLKK